MNKLCIQGNITRDPEMRVTRDGVQVCTFTVAVNRRAPKGAEQTDFFKVTAWRGLAESCGKYLMKGRKVMVWGPVGVEAYEGRDGKTHVEMKVTAEDVEFVGGRETGAGSSSEFGGRSSELKDADAKEPKKDEWVEVTEGDLPF